MQIYPSFIFSIDNEMILATSSWFCLNISLAHSPMTPADGCTLRFHWKHQSPRRRAPQLTWDAQTPVAVAHAATDAVGTGVQGTEVHQLGACGACEACCAATAKPQGAGALSVARPVVVTGAGGARVHLLLTRCALVTCVRWDAERKRITGSIKA